MQAAVVAIKGTLLIRSWDRARPERSAIAAVNSSTVLADISSRCRPCCATSEGVTLMTGPVGLLMTIVSGDLGALGGPLLCARLDAPQLPNPARMRHVTWSRAHFDGALLRRKTVDERDEWAQRLNGSMLAAPKKAPTATVRQNVSNVPG
eukprot:scaffold29781_cov70-Phaeocystis_antarctica.AAC.2